MTLWRNDGRVPSARTHSRVPFGRQYSEQLGLTEPAALRRGWAGAPAAGEQVFTIYSERGAAEPWNFFLVSCVDATNRK